MAKSQEIGLYTVPSTWVIDSKELDEPYRRIVGIEYGSGMPSIDWSLVTPSRPQSYYERSSASLEVITMPELTAERLIGFFKRFFADKPRSRPQYSFRDHRYMGEQTEGYNCHRFGYWMRGVIAAQDFDGPPAPDHITEFFPAKTPLPIGRHGVLGTPGSAVHSVVGLGQNNEECLQVLSTSGHMGMDTYEHVVDQYDYMRNKGMQFYV